MSYAKVVTALALMKALVENQSIYNTGNRSYDSDAKAGASSVDVDLMPTLVAKTTGSTATHADRKGPADTTKLNIPLGPLVVPTRTAKIDEYSTNGRMMSDFIEGAKNAMGAKFDYSFIDTIQTVGNVVPKGALTWEDIISMMSRMTMNAVPQTQRYGWIDAQLESDFCALDIVKQAMAFNPNYLENGIIKVKGVTWFVTANAPELATYPTAGVYYGPGVPFILAKFMDTERVYDGENVQVMTDFISYYGTKMGRAAYGEVLKIG